MEKANVYIQKIIVFALVATIGIFLFPILKLYYLLPLLFLTLSYLLFRVTGKKPDFLFGLMKINDSLNNKSPFLAPLKWFILTAGLLFDMVAWTINGVFEFFYFIYDIILLIKSVIFWISVAFIWFLKLLVPPLIIIYKLVIYYLFQWNWWIYKLSFRNIGNVLNLNYYRIAFRGSVIMLFVILLFYLAGLITGVPGIIFIGFAFSLLPVIWSFTEISALRYRAEEHNPFDQVKQKFGSGFDAVKAILVYFIALLLLAIAVLIFNISGFIPGTGFSFMGLALNLNTFLILTGIFLFVILAFSKFIVPPYIIYNKEFIANINGSINLLAVIGRKFLRYIPVTLPSAFFGFLIMIIPGFIVGLSILITVNIKNSIIDNRLDNLKERSTIYEGIEKYRLSREIERLQYLKNFPRKALADFTEFKSLGSKVNNLKKNIDAGRNESSKLSSEFTASIDSLQRKIENLRARPVNDSLVRKELARIELLRKSQVESYSHWREETEVTLEKMTIDLGFQRSLLIQLPVAGVFLALWIAIFGGLVIACLFSYLGNVFFELYNLKEDNKPLYLRQVVLEANAADRKQPLLGFTILFLIIVILALYNPVWKLTRLFFE